MGYASVYAQAIKSVSFKDGAHAYAVSTDVRDPRAILVMFTGGDGNLRLLERGSLRGINVLIRIRSALEDAGIKLLYVDIPDRSFSRADSDYAKSVGEMISMENTGKLPVFVAGVSRGSISAVNVASRTQIAGVILLSAVTGNTYDGTVRSAPFAEITVPALLFVHDQDACVSSGSQAALRSFADDMKKSKTTILVLRGGKDEGEGSGRAAACHPKSHHGCNGIEDGVADAILK